MLSTITRKTAVCVKKKSKGEIIRELQQQLTEQRAQMQQLEMHRLELAKQVMALDAENKQLKSTIEALRHSSAFYRSQPSRDDRILSPPTVVQSAFPTIISLPTHLQQIPGHQIQPQVVEHLPNTVYVSTFDASRAGVPTGFAFPNVGPMGKN